MINTINDIINPIQKKLAADIERLKDGQNEGFNRIDKCKDKQAELIESIGNLKEAIKENKIDDLVNSDEMKTRIMQMATKSSKKTTLKYGAGIITAIETLRQIIDNI